MDTSPAQPANTDANIRKAAEALAEVMEMKHEFIRCHNFLAEKTARLVDLLCEAESRGYLLEDCLTIVDTTFWLQMIDWQSKFVSVVLNFTKDPGRKTLRPLIELFGRDRERMRVEAEMLERQLKHRLDRFTEPTDEDVRKVVRKNEQRVLGVYLHIRSGYRGVDVARFFKVPKTTAYGWIDWFKSLPVGLQEGVLQFLDKQAPNMAACQVPVYVKQQKKPDAVSATTETSPEQSLKSLP
jgi:hypothetical protein